MYLDCKLSVHKNVGYWLVKKIFKLGPNIRLDNSITMYHIRFWLKPVSDIWKINIKNLWFMVMSTYDQIHQIYRTLVSYNLSWDPFCYNLSYYDLFILESGYCLRIKFLLK